jgi:ligand-binding SRPBCC domain-containing protein
VGREHVLERTQVVPFPVEDAFGFFADARNLERITPPWLRFRILEAPPELRAGSRLRYRLRLFGVPIGWRTEITEWTPPRGFTDVQRRGPFRVWVHTHRLTPVAGGTEIHDHVRYGLYVGLFLPVVRRWVEQIFDFRARTVSAEIARARGEPPPRTS